MIKVLTEFLLKSNKIKQHISNLINSINLNLNTYSKVFLSF